jgi:CubicO group peptidase (beta-lactamase class C family)
LATRARPFLRTLAAKDRILAPDLTFSYSNIGYSLAGFAAAEASHVTFAELVRRRVRPIAHDTRLWPAGYAFTTASDLSRFAIALLDSGKVVTGIVRTARFVAAGPNDRSRLRFVLPSRVPALRTLGVPRVS